MDSFRRYETLLLFSILALIVFLLTSCAGAPGPVAVTPDKSDLLLEISPTLATPTIESESPAPTSSSSLAPKTGAPFYLITDEQLQSAILDLADRLGVEPGAVQVINVVADEFPAGDLGCTAPGVTPRPIPAFVSGYTITLQVSSVQYIYHSHRDLVLFCGPW